MKVVVRERYVFRNSPRLGSPLTYEAPEGTRIGDEGTCAIKDARLGLRSMRAVVVSLHTDYTGPCRDFAPDRLGLDTPAGAGDSVEAYRG